MYRNYISKEIICRSKHCLHHVLSSRSDIYLSIYLKSQDYGDVGAEAQQGRLTM